MLSKTRRAVPFGKDDLPKRGEWFWVRDSEKDDKPALMCVEHIGSNFVRFTAAHGSGGSFDHTTHHRDLLKLTVPEPKWKEILERRSLNKQKELADAVHRLADKVKAADLLPAEGQAPSMLPSTTRVDPKRKKYALLTLKNKTLPAAEKAVDQIIKEMVAIQRDLVMPMLIECKRMCGLKDKIEDRLFVLELYAGIGEAAEQIGEGEPAPPETPITIRQMLRYMDEETLIDYDHGGMDFRSLKDFDKWIAAPENYERILPEPRCVVAFKVRRHLKDYGPCGDLAGAFRQMEEHYRNMKTYLCIRNGAQIWRLATDIEFEPRLLPFRDEFHKPFEVPDEYGTWVDEDGKPNFTGHKKVYRDPEAVTPDDVRYDAHIDKRKKLIFQYNRILFLIQGILDRSKVFSPHPPINLSDMEHVRNFVHANHDEELGLPSSNPPSWEAYRDEKNAQMKVGGFAWATWTEENRDRGRFSYERSDKVFKGIYKVTSIKKDRTAVRVSWSRGRREGYEFPTGWWSGYGRWGTWDYKNKWCHKWIPMKDCFNVDAYVPGEYKVFLCDAYLKGAYLQWAPQLLSAEKHWREPE